MMNPFDLDPTGLLIWGLVIHLVADWLLQNEWMALNKMRRRNRPFRDLLRPEIIHHNTVVTPWWDRHPAAWIHAGIHGVLLALVFGWVAAPLALTHLVIDTRKPVEWWSRLVRQSQPDTRPILVCHDFGEWREAVETASDLVAGPWTPPHPRANLVDVGLFVRFWNDQVWHIVCIAIAALIVGTL